MKIETNKKYRTREGGSVFIKYNQIDMGFSYSIFPFVGTLTDIRGIKSSASFTIEGGYYGVGNHKFDIIEEIL
jgi:hypothetical protein